LTIGIDLFSYLSDMAYPYTRSRARSELEERDVEPSDAAPSAATSSFPPSIYVGPSDATVGGPLSTELVGPMSVPTYYLPAGSPPSSGGHGVSGPANPPQMGVSTQGYPSSLAGPPDSSAYGGGQISYSLATGIAEAAQLELSSSSLSLAAVHGTYRQQLASRQPPATAATETAVTEGPTMAPTDDRPTRHAQSLSARTSSSFRTLSPPILSPVYVVEQS